MQRFLSLLILLHAATSVSAWSLIWKNEDGKSYVEEGNDPVDCRKIEHAEGEEFRWNPGDDGLSIWLYEDDKCTGYRAGYSPPSVWNRVSSRDLGSFRVASEDEDEDEDTTSTTTTKPTTTTTSETTSTKTETETKTGADDETTTTTTPTKTKTETETGAEGETTTTTPSPTPTSTAETISTPTSSPSETPTDEPSDSNDSSVSGGAVAGGVIGGIAGVAAIGGLFFFLGRRRRLSKFELAPGGSGFDSRPATSAAPPQPPEPTPMYGAATAYGAASGVPYDPSFYEGKPELDSGPVYQEQSPAYPGDPIKHAYSPLEAPAAPAYRPSTTVMAELPGDGVMIEMSDTHKVSELDGGGTPMKR
ncbi:uncharacterized protein BJX67DRAFT_166947 [Aspergillus lucknowensis]|uniref:Mid2 domain-containing protein n=1 Tax=Aspergillus lucknowensis TaxID=176173 RepID=A0ABR4M4X9_9EURO